MAEFTANYDPFRAKLNYTDIIWFENLGQLTETELWESDISARLDAYSRLQKFSKHTPEQLLLLEGTEERSILARSVAWDLMTFCGKDPSSTSIECETVSKDGGSRSLRLIYNPRRGRLNCSVYASNGDELVCAYMPLDLDMIDDDTMSATFRNFNGKLLEVKPLSLDEERASEQLEYFQVLQGIIIDGTPNFSTASDQTQAA